VFNTQNIHRHPLKVAEQSEIVLNSGLGKRAMITSEERSCLLSRIWRFNQPLRMGVANRGLEILYLPIPDSIHRSAYALVLCAHFAPDAQERASEDGTARFLKLCQTVVHVVEIAIEPLERRNCWRKKSVHVRLVFVPFCLQRSNGEFGLRLEEIVKASLFGPGPLTDRVY